VLSKRKLIKLVEGKYVRGWDDPRLATINGYRRRGYTPSAINRFCEQIGVTRSNSVISYKVLEECCRVDLNPTVARRFCVLHPLKVTLANIDENEVEWRDVPNHPFDASKGTHRLALSKTVFIEQSDFRLEDVKGYYGLAPGKEVLLKYFYNIKCVEVITNHNSEPVELICTVDKSNTTKCKGVIHWVAQLPSETPVVAEVRLYEALFDVENPAELDDWLSHINPNSLVVVPNAIVEPGLKGALPWERFQFERVGYFMVDPDTTPEKLVFNRTVPLKESKEKDEIAQDKKPSAKAH